MNLEIRIHKTFLRELASIPLKERVKIEEYVFHLMPKSDSLNQLPDIKRLKGYKNYYRIRFGDYRAGFRITDNILILERLIHRKDIYKYYP